MKVCATCKHWKPAFDENLQRKIDDPLRRDQPTLLSYAVGGLCQSHKLQEETFGLDELNYTHGSQGLFWTGPIFGCVHHVVV